MIFFIILINVYALVIIIAACTEKDDLIIKWYLMNIKMLMEIFFLTKESRRHEETLVMDQRTLDINANYRSGQ